MVTKKSSALMRKNEKRDSLVPSSATDVIQHGDITDLVHNNVKSAIVELLNYDAGIMKAIIESVSRAVVNKIDENPDFKDMITESIVKSRQIDEVNPLDLRI